MLYHIYSSPIIRFGVSLVALATASPAVSQTPASSTVQEEEQGAADDLHDRSRDAQGQIVVSAQGLRQLDLLAGTSVLEGDALQRNLGGPIGEVLAGLPGVSASGFAPGVSRPVLRGFSGERVRVLIDGIGTIDASSTSDDHAVAVDPLVAERIEVLRGPAVLLYGSQAIGGAVNIIDKRIPRRIPAEPVHIDALAGFDSVNDQTQLGASIDAPLGGGFVVHASGSRTDAGDLRVPGFIVAEDLRAGLLGQAAAEDAQGHGEEAAELREIAGRRGVLPNSYARSWSASAGAGFFAGDSMLGASVSWFDTLYGVPERPGAGHSEAGTIEEAEPAPVSIDLKQFRADLRGELALGGGFLDRLITRVGYTDYTHTEFEGAETGTIFDVKGIEARAELVQSRRGALRGSMGAQYYYRDFAATGGEAFVAPNRTDQFGLFTLQELALGPVQLEAAGRYEWTSVDAPRLGLSRDFRAFSAALGVAYEPDEGLRLGINASRASRAPSGEELYAGGPHVATQAFEIGDPDLGLERAWGLEAYARGRLGPARLNLAIYRNRFDGYIYLAATGAERDGLPEFAIRQAEARHFGVEGEVSLPVIARDGFTLLADVRGDYIRAGLADGTPLPRIPPLRLAGGLEAQVEDLEARMEVEWFAAQNRVARFETPTPAFAHLNASLGWKPRIGDGRVTLLLQADNILNAEGRRHASLTKDFVPLPGRNIKVSARASF